MISLELASLKCEPKQKEVKLLDIHITGRR